MSYRHFLTGLCILTLSACASCQSAPPPPSPTPEPVHLIILHMNDLHGQLLSRPAPWLGEDPIPEVGGLATLASYLRTLRSEAKVTGAHVLVLDAGDLYQGTPEGDIPEGRLTVDLLNLMEYDAWLVGNHDFDKGVPNLRNLSERARFPLLGANVRDVATGRRPDFLRDYLMCEYEGLRVGVLGVTTSEMKMMTSRRSTEGLEFAPEEETIVTSLRRMEKDGAKTVILLTHCGLDVDQTLAGRFPNIAVILGGHTHVRLAQAWRHPRTGVPVCQTAGAGTDVDRVDLTLDPRTGKVLSFRQQLVPLRSDLYTPDPAVLAAIDEVRPAIEEVMGQPAGTATVEIPRKSVGSDSVSSPLGNLVTDIMRDATGADLAFNNRTGIRAGIPAGPITRRTMYLVSPFGNTMVSMNLTGAQILELIEYSVSEGAHRILEMSGGSVLYDPVRPIGERVISIEVGGKPLEPKRTYRVATNSYIAQGGSGHQVFAQGVDRQDSGIDLLDAQVAYALAHDPLEADTSPRIRLTVSPKPEEGAPEEVPADSGAREK